MKKLLTKISGVILAVVCMFSMTACGETLLIGKEFTAATSQVDALSKLDKGEADVAVIDSVMAGYYTSTGEYANKMQMVEGLVLAEEKYGIAAKKGNDALISKINEALIAIRTTDYATVASKYGLNSSIALTQDTTNPKATASDDSWNELVSSGTLVIGYTLFAPIAFKENNVLQGFDIELAEKVVAWLNTQYSVNLTVQFELIEWSTKEAKLEDGTLDLVWNGMTITPEREAGMCISIPYLYNKQVAVIMKEDATKYTDKESMKNAIMTAEKGSAGESVIVGEKEE